MGWSFICTHSRGHMWHPLGGREKKVSFWIDYRAGSCPLCSWLPSGSPLFSFLFSSSVGRFTRTCAVSNFWIARVFFLWFAALFYANKPFVPCTSFLPLGGWKSCNGKSLFIIQSSGGSNGRQIGSGRASVAVRILSAGGVKTLESCYDSHQKKKTGFFWDSKRISIFK
jgi:hypothetical protein